MEPESASAESVELIGYTEAAQYLGMEPNTLSGYVSRGIGPQVSDRRPDGQYVRPVFTREDLDRWKNERRGQGFRSDLIKEAEAS
jgi:hypothetical protein